MKNVFFILTVCFFSSCGGNASEPRMRADDFSTESAEADYEFQATSAEGTFAKADFQAPEAEQAPQKVKQPTKKLIKTADLILEVEQYDKAVQKARELVAAQQGAITKETEAKSTYRWENRLEIRVQPEQFDALVEGLLPLALNTDHKTISTMDVTRQYVDLETRLSTKRAVVQRYREILQAATSVEDILAVEESMRIVIEEIESVEGQLRYLSNQVDQSTINLTIYERLDQPQVKRKSFLGRLVISLFDGWHFFVESLLGIIAVWPLWIVVGGAILVFAKRKKK